MFRSIEGYPEVAQRPKVSIIVVNYNGEQLLAECLDAVRRQSYPNYEVIVVDNGSKDASIALVRQRYPEARLIELAENFGFSGGNIAGLQIADGDMIALLNNDARPAEKWLENLVAPMVRDPTVGICAARLLLDDGTDNINSAGDGVTTAGVGFNRGLGEDGTSYRAADLVFGACAAAVLYRRKMLEEIGFLDEDFFLYDEDTDINFRAQLAGWKCVYVADAIAHHKVNATSGRLSDLAVYYHTRNLEFVWLKNMPKSLMVRFLHHKVIQEIGAFCYLCLRHGKWSAYLRAKRDALKMMPRILQKRKRIQQSRRVSDRYIRSLLTSVFSHSMIRQKIIQFVRG